ncbi:MAG: MFS transporter [Anaerolineaceae bacterium]|nr:MFS transporter [Anaerolineaceae bacterium]
MKLLPPACLSAFHNRALLRLCAGELISTAGSALTTLAASILVYRQTGSTLQVSLLLVAAALPSLLVGLIAGVFVDRLDRKRVLIASDLGRAVLSFLIPLTISHGSFWLYAIVFLSSAVGQFFNPAHESILADIAKEKERTRANSLMALSGFGATTLGFAACGLIVSHFPLQWAFYLDAFSYLFSVLCIGGIGAAGSRSNEIPRPLAAVFSDFKSGCGYLMQNAGLRALLSASVPVVLAFGLWNSLLLPFSLHILHASTYDYGLQEGLTAIGFAAGCLTVMRLGDRLRPVQWILFSVIGLGTVGVYYALCTKIPLAIGLVMVTGLLNAPYSVARRLIIQTSTQRETRGRINSIFLVTRDVAYLIGMSAAGLADVMDIRILVAASGALLLSAGLMMLWLAAPRQVKNEHLVGTI